MSAAEEYLAAIEARVNAATEGPWEYIGRNWVETPLIDITEANWGGEGLHGYRLACVGDEGAWRVEDAQFIAAARQDVPALVAALRAVLDLHNSVPLYELADECECNEDDPDFDTEHFEVDAGELLCHKSPTGDHWCSECGRDEDGNGTDYPCPTVRAIESTLGSTP